jgi:hypothetical protein
VTAALQYLACKYMHRRFTHLGFHNFAIRVAFSVCLNLSAQAELCLSEEEEKVSYIILRKPTQRSQNAIPCPFGAPPMIRDDQTWLCEELTLASIKLSDNM